MERPGGDGEELLELRHHHPLPPGGDLPHPLLQLQHLVVVVVAAVLVLVVLVLMVVVVAQVVEEEEEEAPTSSSLAVSRELREWRSSSSRVHSTTWGWG